MVRHGFALSALVSTEGETQYKRQSFERLPCSQPQAGNTYWEALPALLALLAASRAFPGRTWKRDLTRF
ncbi:hypothetical protein SAMD00079811_46710 [Scytonema sp. HK-05]|nr:hypothetical protein SAMD00079811_46710 [Scytonema sp. HK-05]